jgi:hypothetical protein
VPRGTAEIFFRKVKFWKGDPPPVFVSGLGHLSSVPRRGRRALRSPSSLLPAPGPRPPQNIDGINYLFIKKGSIYFVATTKFNVSPSFTLELLDRVAKVFKDYCGLLSEEAIRKNFILLYELLDEMIVRARAADAGGGRGDGARERAQQGAMAPSEIAVPSPPTPPHSTRIRRGGSGPAGLQGDIFSRGSEPHRFVAVVGALVLESPPHPSPPPSTPPPLPPSFARARRTTATPSPRRPRR